MCIEVFISPSVAEILCQFQHILQALLDWERWRLDTDQTGLKLLWVGDDPSGLLLPSRLAPDVVWHEE